VLTNNHVIDNASKLTISFADGTQLPGKLVGADPDNDLAVVKFDPPKGMNIKTVPYGDSSTLKVGQKVLAIGNPFGLDRTLTVGVVSALGRPIRNPQTSLIMRNMIQTDASINPGNSGGPLLDAHGRMIGINSQIYSQSGGSVGIGFAIPVNTAKRVVAELIQYGKVRRGWIDANFVQLNQDIVDYAKLPVSSGLLVSSVKKGGLAAKAGLKAGTEPVRYGRSVIYLGGDVVTKVDGMKVSSLTDLFSALEDNKPGDRVSVTVNRKGKTETLNIPLADRSDYVQE
jgi:S1-C subfamily serine protease